MKVVLASLMKTYIIQIRIIIAVTRIVRVDTLEELALETPSMESNLY